MKIRRNLFTFEITSVLIFKILVMVTLKIFFFTDPVDRTLSAPFVEQRLLGNSPMIPGDSF
jgi:hypothetical protein